MDFRDINCPKEDIYRYDNNGIGYGVSYYSYCSNYKVIDNLLNLVSSIITNPDDRNLQLQLVVNSIMYLDTYDKHPTYFKLPESVVPLLREIKSVFILNPFVEENKKQIKKTIENIKKYVFKTNLFYHHSTNTIERINKMLYDCHPNLYYNHGYHKY